MMAEEFEPEADRVMASEEPEADRVMAEEFELSQESGGELVPQPLLSSMVGKKCKNTLFRFFEKLEIPETYWVIIDSNFDVFLKKVQTASPLFLEILRFLVSIR